MIGLFIEPPNKKFDALTSLHSCWRGTNGAGSVYHQMFLAVMGSSFSELDYISKPLDGSFAEERRRKRNSRIPKVVRQRDGSFCQACNTYCGRGEVHHIHPLSMGGDDSIENAILLCGTCHKHAPDTAKEFLEYQRRGGKYPEIMTSILERNYHEGGFGSKTDQREKYRDALDQLKRAIYLEDRDTLYSFTHRPREHEYGIVKLAPYVNLAISGKMSVDAARKANIKAMQNQIRVINWAKSIYPVLPKPPSSVKEEDWKDEDAIDGHLAEWSVAWKIYDMANDKTVPMLAFHMYYNCWLAVESLIDFLDIEDNTFLVAKGVPQHSSCFLARNRPQEGSEEYES